MRTAHPVLWPVSRLARRIGPDVCSVPGLGYVVSGAELLRRILLDTTRFRKDGASSVGTVITQVFGPTALANMEGEEHASLRRALSGLFAPRASESLLDATARPALQSLATRLSSGRPAELAREGKVLAATVMSALVAGRTESDPSSALAVHDTATRLAGILSARVRPLRPNEVVTARRVRDELIGLLEPDLGSADPTTIAGCLRREGLSEAEIRGVAAMVLVAGVETTSVAIGRAVALCSDLALWPRLGSDPAFVRTAVDEALRYVSPLPVCTRTVASTCEVDGHWFRGGRTVICHLYNAVRDPRVIERADEFDPERAVPPTLRHLWFGAGPHFCVGMPIARDLLIRTVRSLADRGGVRIVSRTPARRVLIPAYAALHVEASSVRAAVA